MQHMRRATGSRHSANIDPRMGRPCFMPEQTREPCQIPTTRAISACVFSYSARALRVVHGGSDVAAITQMIQGRARLGDAARAWTRVDPQS
eukprot:1035488-Pyramimonas_sp.AAC.1